MGIKLLSLFIACLVLFLFGLTIMKYGFQQLSGKKLEKWIYRCTNAPIKAFFTGIAATALVHSSSLVMIITISFVSAGLLTFKDAVGIILGSNIGTTFTTEFLAVNIDDDLGWWIAISFCLMLFRKSFLFSIGCSLFGMACIFLSLNGFEKLASPLSHSLMASRFLTEFQHHLLLAILASSVLTGIIQSSTAMTGLVMSFMNEQIMPLETGMAFVLGANIGTCITALIASIGANEEAKNTAYAHLLLNVFGVLLFIPLMPMFPNLLKTLTNEPDFQIAHFSLIFNAVTSLIVLPLTEQYANLIIWWTKTVSKFYRK